VWLVPVESVVVRVRLVCQDRDGNVWYFGENSHEGVDGAQPGIVMPGTLQPGVAYRQEYRSGIAEDMAKALKLHAAADVPYGGATTAAPPLARARAVVVPPPVRSLTALAHSRRFARQP
jgi:hypothetical protein